jgi:zinc protease
MLLVVGDFETTALLKKIEKYFGTINSQVAPPPLQAIEPPQQAERRVCLRRPGTAAYLQMGYHIPSPSHEDFVALIMLDAVLSGAKSFGFSSGAWMGRSSRLYRALVDANLASAAGSSMPFYQDPSLFSFWATARTGIEPQQVEEALLNELHRIADAPPTTQELEKALRQTRAQLAYGLDGVTGQAFALGYFTSIASYDYLDTLVENLSKVKPADVQKIAAKYLQTENQTLGWFIPTEEPAGEAEKGAPPKVFHFSSKQSKASSEAKVALPVERFPLSFGGVLLVCPNPNVPIAGIRGSLSAGGIRETDEVAGLAGFTSRLVMRGTQKRTYQQGAEEVESLGASLSFGASFEEAYCSAKCLSGDVAHLLEVISDCWRNPIFPSNEIDKVRSEMLTGIREQMDDTRTVAEQTFRRLLYPAGHAYGRNGMGSEETIAVISREQLAGFHHSYFRPQDLILVIVGDVHPLAARDAVEEAFAGWQKGRPAQPPVPAIVLRQKALTEVKSMMHKSQADIVLGFPALKRTDEDYYAADLANLIVGRLGLYGRLGKKVRDEQGLAYYSFSRLQAWKHAGHWIVQAGVNPKNVAKAHDSILLELKRLTSEPVAEEELADAKSNQIGSLALRLETNDGIAGALLEMEYYQLGLYYLQRFPAIIRSLTKEQLMEAAKRYLATEAFLEVIAGPYKKS